MPRIRSMSLSGRTYANQRSQPVSQSVWFRCDAMRRDAMRHTQVRSQKARYESNAIVPVWLQYVLGYERAVLNAMATKTPSSYRQRSRTRTSEQPRDHTHTHASKVNNDSTQQVLPNQIKSNQKNQIIYIAPSCRISYLYLYSFNPCNS